VTIRGRSPGCVLHGLDLLGSPAVDGVRVHGLSNLPGEPPLVIERCSVRGAYDAILVRGPMPGAGGAIRTSGGVVRQNRLAGARRGISLSGGLGHAQVVGNLIWDCEEAGIQADDVPEDCGPLLFANNTVFRSGAGFRLWDRKPFKNYLRGRVELRNNLLLR